MSLSHTALVYGGALTGILGGAGGFGSFVLAVIAFRRGDGKPKHPPKKNTRKRRQNTKTRQTTIEIPAPTSVRKDEDGRADSPSIEEPSDG